MNQLKPRRQQHRFVIGNPMKTERHINFMTDNGQKNFGKAVLEIASVKAKELRNNKIFQEGGQDEKSKKYLCRC